MQYLNQETETENAIIRRRAGWSDVVIILLTAAIIIAAFSLPTFAVEPKLQLVTVTKFVCQPTPHAVATEWGRP